MCVRCWCVKFTCVPAVPPRAVVRVFLVISCRYRQCCRAGIPGGIHPLKTCQSVACVAFMGSRVGFCSGT